LTEPSPISILPNWLAASEGGPGGLTEPSPNSILANWSEPSPISILKNWSAASDGEPGGRLGFGGLFGFGGLNPLTTMIKAPASKAIKTAGNSHPGVPEVELGPGF
jgi:hypothetical protein